MKRPNKYRNRPVTVDGTRYDSQREYARWRELQLLERAGQITGLERQRAFVLAPPVRFDGEKRQKPALRYVCDFYYAENGYRVVEDVKSAPTAKTQLFRCKRHLMKSLYGLEIRIVK